MRQFVPGRIAALLIPIVLSAACDRVFPPRRTALPTPAQADSVFRANGVAGEVSLSGNVVEVSVAQPEAQLRQGGALWARVGPYIYLFTPATAALFESYPGLAGVRARTRVGGREVASALLVRDTMRAGEWAEAVSLLAQALREGTARPSRLEDLVRWGERFTTYRYDPAFAPDANVPER